MPDVTIYFNPHCSKSRETLGLLRQRGIEPTVVEYLESPPDEETLDRLLRLLEIEPADLLRSKEKDYENLGLAGKLDDRKALVAAMAAHPILIERPIVVAGDRARPGASSAAGARYTLTGRSASRLCNSAHEA